jgi:hypothetical protein
MDERVGLRKEEEKKGPSDLTLGSMFFIFCCIIAVSYK